MSRLSGLLRVCGVASINDDLEVRAGYFSLQLPQIGDEL